MTTHGKEHAVRIVGATRRFGAAIAVNELTISVSAGQVFGLIGPNGAGKTTTFSMMAGYLRPTDGHIEILGQRPTDVDALRGRVGVLPQDALLPSGDTVGDFLVHMARLQDLGPTASRAAKAALDEVDGSAWWSRKCGALSHGMAKRVGIAQAFLGAPEVVLLDEPTAGLDPRVAYEMRQLVKAKKGKATLIVSSHNLQELEELCDAAAVLDRGKLVASGSIAELTAAEEEIRVKLAGGPVPLEAVRALAPMVRRAEFDADRRELIVHFERANHDAEAVIGATLGVLLNERARISGVTKGRGLEKRVMEITE